ncbi:MAG: hypothetical protein HY862_06420 [Chloroflexi bacterium]|nr:hypothetical protein [Chloroflexota bacterium]
MNAGLDSTNHEPREIAPGLTQEWLYDGQVEFFKLTDATREAIDAWIDATLESLIHWPVNRPYYGLVQMSTSAAHIIIVNGYARQRIEELMQSFPSISGYHAILMPRTVMKNVTSFVQRLFEESSRPTQIFFDMDNVFAWLDGQL